MRAISPSESMRDVTRVLAPPSSGAAPPYNKKPLPTFLLRKQGDAWHNPFVLAYESTSGEEPFIIQSVQRLFNQNTFAGVKVTIEANGQAITQTIFINENKNDIYQNNAEELYFKGQFGIISINHDNGSGDLYIGQGSEIKYGEHELKAMHSESAYKAF
jgi:hypothetical protein